MEKIPGIISQRKEKNEALAKDIPQLQELAGKVWKKEDELKQLKSELSALDRKDTVGACSACSGERGTGKETGSRYF